MDPEALLEFIRLHRLAVQTSVSAVGTPQAAIVGFAVTDQFEIIFDTLQTTRKVQNLRKNPPIALVINYTQTSVPGTGIYNRTYTGRNANAWNRNWTLPAIIALLIVLMLFKFLLR